MLAATALAIFVIPLLFVLFESLAAKLRGTAPELSHEEGGH
jgi:hypothetical protein